VPANHIPVTSRRASLVVPNLHPLVNNFPQTLWRISRPLIGSEDTGKTSL
jgi:hypothetical protein